MFGFGSTLTWIQVLEIGAILTFLSGLANAYVPAPYRERVANGPLDGLNVICVIVDLHIGLYLYLAIAGIAVTVAMGFYTTTTAGTLLDLLGGDLVALLYVIVLTFGGMFVSLSFIACLGTLGERVKLAILRQHYKYIDNATGTRVRVVDMRY